MPCQVFRCLQGLYITFLLLLLSCLRDNMEIPENTLLVDLPITSHVALEILTIFATKLRVIWCRFDNFTMEDTIELEKSTRGQAKQRVHCGITLEE